MTFTRPSFDDEKARILNDLGALPQVLAEPLSATWARSCYGQYGYLDWIDQQNSPLTCDQDRLYDWASLYSVPQLQATFASGNVLATGVAGTPILAATVIRGQNGLNYTVIAEVTLGFGPTPIAVVCATAGSASNLIANQTLTLVDPVLGCANTLTVDSSGLTGGEEAEQVDTWRGRVVSEWQQIVTIGARSGKPDDYRYWSKTAHPSVTTALVQLHTLGIGTVVVRPICNGLGNRLPSPAVLTAVSAYLQTIAPGVADWRVVAPNLQAVTITIHLFPGYDSDANRSAISLALNSLILSLVDENAILAEAMINAAIASVTTQYSLISPTVDTEVSAGSIFVLNPVVWAT